MTRSETPIIERGYVITDTEKDGDTYRVTATETGENAPASGHGSVVCKRCRAIIMSCRCMMNDRISSTVPECVNC
jgi:hypothetical protein